MVWLSIYGFHTNKTFLGEINMVKVKDISETYIKNKEEHLNKDVYVDNGKELIKTNWVHQVGDKIVLSLKNKRFKVVPYMLNEWNYEEEKMETKYTYAIEDTMSDCEPMEFIDEDDAEYVCNLFNNMSEEDLIERWVIVNEH